MNTKKITKILSVLLIVISILSVFSMVFASSEMTIPTAAQPVGGTGKIQTVTSNVIWIVQLICYAAAVIMLMYLGVKFITASPEGKAEIKKSAVIYVIGALMVFAAGAILGVIKDLSVGISSGASSTK